MTEHQEPERARGIEIPYEPEFVLSPTVVYGPPLSALYFQTKDEEAHVRVTFEGLDAIKACRGEYPPFPTDGVSSVYIVEGSRWLRERHAYEATHYRGHYEWGNDVDEILTDYD